MKNEDENSNGFESLMSITLQGGSASIQFAVPDFLKPLDRSKKMLDLAVEYYILSRFSYFHHMERTYMLNTFWTVEYLFLSILSFEFESFQKLKDSFEIHNLSTYWKHIKEDESDKSKQAILSKFDGTISRIHGYYDERYQSKDSGEKITFQGKKVPKVKVATGDGNMKKKNKFPLVRPLNLDDIDHLFNFFLCDLSVIKNNSEEVLSSMLLRRKVIDLYKQENSFSILYPNRIYFGEYHNEN